MASKKLSAQTPVAEKSAKPTKTVNTAAPVAAAKTVKTPALVTTTKAVKVVEPVAKKAPVKVAVPAVAAKTTKVAEPIAAKVPAKTVAPVAKTSKVTFLLPKEAVENAETVAVFGDFNNWQGGVILSKQKDGSFKTAVELEKGRSYEYRFLINGVKWENDWAAEAYAATPFGTYNSVVTAK